MKTRIPHSNCTGSALLVTMMTGLIVGAVLVSYLTLVRHQNATVARSQSWNAAMGAAEAGVEEALAQLTHVPLTTNINRSANNWVYDAGSYRVPSARTVLHGSYNVRFTDIPQPVIYATGTITDPALNATLTRTLEVRTTNAPVFSVGMAALMNIKMNGNNIYTDSYISTNSAYSTGGQYDPAKARKNGDVASVGGLVTVGTGTINGDLLTGPAGSVSTNNGTITGTYQNDFNAEYQDVKTPTNLTAFVSASSVSTNIAGTTYAYAFHKKFANDYYRVDTGINGSIYVGPDAQVTLYITANVNMSGNIYIAPSAKLTIYMAGTTFKIGGVENSGTPVQFSYLGLPSNTSISFTGTGAQLTGTIYAPEAALNMNGGAIIYGACVVKSADMNGNAEFHYDEALTTYGPTIYKAASWREL